MGHSPDKDKPAPIPAVAIVTFPAVTDLDNRTVRELLERAGPAYASIPGLRRKYFLAGDGIAGGVYEWTSRAVAEAFYDEAWYAATRESAGAEPDVQLFDSPAIADGIMHTLDIFVPAD